MRILLGGFIIGALMYSGVLQLFPTRSLQCEAPPKSEGAIYQSAKWELHWPKF